MTLPTYFRSGTNKLVNYDFFDIANGTGIVTYYGMMDQSGAGLLITTQTYSDKVQSWALLSGGIVYMPTFDKDFDVTINTPVTFKGIMTAIIPSFLYVQEGATENYGYFDVKLRKWDGTTETEITSERSANQHKDNAGMFFHEDIHCIRMSVPEITFQKGEVLRVSLQGYGYTNATTGLHRHYIAHDPKNRAPANEGDTGGFSGAMITQMSINMPVKIDL